MRLAPLIAGALAFAGAETARLAFADPNVTFTATTGAWKKGGTTAPPLYTTDGTSTTSSVFADAGTVAGAVSRTERSSASFKGTVAFTVHSASGVRIFTEVKLHLENAGIGYKARLYRGKKAVGTPLFVNWLQLTPGQDVDFNLIREIPSLAPGDYVVRAVYKLKRTKNGSWDQRLPSSRPFTVTVTELP